MNLENLTSRTHYWHLLDSQYQLNGEPSVEQKCIYEYYQFGTRLWFLLNASKGQIIKNQDVQMHVLHHLEMVINTVYDLNLQVTSRILGNLQEIRDDLSTVDDGSLLSSEQASLLSNEIKDLRRTLEAELGGFSAYVVSPKRINIDSLVDSISDIFQPGVYAKLPDLAQFDFSEAGKCIAFERPTAAAFHILRATECVLRSFYRNLIKRDRCKSEMWGPIVNDLRKKRKAQKYEVLINHLDNIRRSFRNPTQHPEKIYDIHEVQDLFNLCVDVANRMADEL